MTGCTRSENAHLNLSAHLPFSSMRSKYQTSWEKSAEQSDRPRFPGDNTTSPCCALSDPHCTVQCHNASHTEKSFWQMLRSRAELRALYRSCVMFCRSYKGNRAGSSAIPSVPFSALLSIQALNSWSSFSSAEMGAPRFRPCPQCGVLDLHVGSCGPLFAKLQAVPHA